jgi:hypothetical protein
MANTPTANIGLNKPAQGDVPWDATMNANLDRIDSCLSGGVQLPGIKATAITSSSLVQPSSGNVVSLAAAPIGNSGAITGTGAPVTLFTFQLPANIVATGKGLRINFALLHTGAVAVTYTLTVNGVTIFSIGTGDAQIAGIETLLATAATTAAGAGWLVKVASGLLTGGSVNTVAGLNWAAIQTVALTFTVAATDSVTPIFFIPEVIQ